MRQWSIQIMMLDQAGNEIPANIVDRVTYTLHPTFANPTRTLKTQPFKVEEQGWGEFDIPISIHIVGLTGKQGERKFNHDLNFLQERYVIDHVISVPTNKSQILNNFLLESGPLPAGDNLELNSKRRVEGDAGSKVKKQKSSQSPMKGSVDLEKLANGLTKLSEDDLIVIVQMVTDNRTSEMNIKNDVDNGEFIMDLYTLPESLLKSLWEYTKKHTPDS